ncbi:unnamed protein product [Sympodiomycopsis kandeliae]
MWSTPLRQSYTRSQISRNNNAIIDKVIRSQKILSEKPSQVILPYKVAQQQQQQQASSSASSSSSSSSPTYGPSHVFQGEQNPETGRWRPAQYSQRRMKQVVTAALEEGRLDEIPSCDMKSEILARLSRSQQSKTQDSYALSSETDLQPLSSGAKRQEEQRSIISQIALAKGPYVGRSIKKIGFKRFFKGTVGQRSRNKKDTKIANNMNNMDATVQEWRRAQAQARAKSRPSQPF